MWKRIDAVTGHFEGRPPARPAGQPRVVGDLRLNNAARLRSRLGRVPEAIPVERLRTLHSRRADRQ